MPKFSIIIPVYNVAPYLRECLDSVLAQTFTDWEAICVDDGSIDESGAILDEYAAKDARFRVFHKENGGVSSARNLALDNAIGERIIFLDGDDLLNKQLLAKVHEAVITEGDFDVIKYKFLSFTDASFNINESHAGRQPSTNEFKVVSSRVDLFRFFATDYIWCLCIKLEIITRNNIRFESFSHCEDSLFNLSCFNFFRKGIIISDFLYFYRQREGSAVHKITKDHFLSAVGVCKRMFEISRQWNDYDLLHKYIYKRICRELAGHIYMVIKLANIDRRERDKWRQIYLDAIEWLFCQNKFHASIIIQKIYQFIGFFSWNVVAFLFLRCPFIVKGVILKMLIFLGVKK